MGPVAERRAHRAQHLLRHDERMGKQGGLVRTRNYSRFPQFFPRSLVSTVSCVVSFPVRGTTEDSENRARAKTRRGYATAIAVGRVGCSRSIGSNNCPNPADS